MDNNFEIIAKFNYDDKNFIITMVNNKTIVYSFYDENNRLHMTLPDKYYEICNLVYNSLFINKNTSVFIKTQNINNNLYNIFFDTKSKNYFWTQSNGTPNLDDNRLLNLRYNNMPLVLYKDNKERNSENPLYYNKMMELHKKFIVVLIATHLSLATLVNCSVLGKDQNISENSSSTQSTVNYTYQQEYNYNEIKRAIDVNPHLSDEEKQLLYNMKFVFDENNQYMNLDMVIERLRTLETEYSSNFDEKWNGCYHSNKNLVQIKADSFEEADISVIVHEFLHVLQSPSSGYTVELSNELCTQEVLRRLEKEQLLGDHHIKYLNGTDSSYDRHLYLYQVLAETIPNEAIRNYQFSCDKNILASALGKIDPESSKNEKGRAYQLIENFNDMKEDYDKYAESNNFSNSEILPSEKDCQDKLNYYYKKQKGIDIAQDVNCFFLAERSGIYIDEKSRLPLFGFLDKLDPDFASSLPITWAQANVIPKTYFSDDIKYLTLECSCIENDKLVKKHFEFTDEIVKKCNDFLIEEHAKTKNDEFEL